MPLRTDVRARRRMRHGSCRDRARASVASTSSASTSTNAMLAAARAKAPDLTWITADLLDVDLGRDVRRRRDAGQRDDLRRARDRGCGRRQHGAPLSHRAAISSPASNSAVGTTSSATTPTAPPPVSRSRPRYATWEGGRGGRGGDYAVSVHRHANVRRPCRSARPAATSVLRTSAISFTSNANGAGTCPVLDLPEIGRLPIERPTVRWPRNGCVGASRRRRGRAPRCASASTPSTGTTRLLRPITRMRDATSAVAASGSSPTLQPLRRRRRSRASPRNASVTCQLSSGVHRTLTHPSRGKRAHVVTRLIARPDGDEQAGHEPSSLARHTLAAMRVGINGSDKLLAPDLGAIAADITQTRSRRLRRRTGWRRRRCSTPSPAWRSPRPAAARSRSARRWCRRGPRHPQAMAAAALTAQAATGGRFVLGIGLLHKPVVEDYLHMTWERPIRHMLDYLDVLQPLLDRGRRRSHRRGVELHRQLGAAHDRPAEGDARRARRADAEDRRPSHRRHDPVVRRPEDDRAPDRADHQRRRQRRRTSRPGDRVQPSRSG